ncbi:hypothetical protein KIN20_020473 [Parelaphostrongylus tenuis]|uniref:Uncharacterized protein n=1 Tax=Parelaphostrongylus tenuis TaxID=148309 RepID=A0AAD5N9V0_PARTN|nr:hypothetical protein KIN20_020473 [Parelaphostrongylus tenuis]
MILIFLVFLDSVLARLCYQCASELALINWSRYGLPRLLDDSMMANDACLDDDRLSSHVPCNAPCMTINVTAIGGKNDGRVVGIVRDCQTYFVSPKSLPEGTTHMCRSSVREMARSQRINVTFCYCEGNLCNGNRSPKHPRRAVQRIHPGSSDASSVNWSFSTYLALLVFSRVLD